MRLSEVAALVGGRVTGKGDPEITGVAGLREAGPGDLSFLAAKRYAPLLATTRAAAVLAVEAITSASGFSTTNVSIWRATRCWSLVHP